MKVSKAQRPFLPVEVLLRLSGDAQANYRRATNRDDRKQWQQFLLAVDAELGARKKKPEKPTKTAREKRNAVDDRPLAERLCEARDAIYGPVRTEAIPKAARLRPKTA